MTAPLELVLKGGNADKVVAVACGECRYVARDIRAAELCCAPRHCSDCGAQMESRSWTACEPCRNRHQSEQERGRFDRAKKVSMKDYEGRMIYSERHEFMDVDSYCDQRDDDIEEGLEPEPYVWGTYPIGLAIDAQGVVENALDDHHEDAFEQVKDIPKLQALIDGWIADQEVETFHVDYAVAVLLTEKRTES